MAGNEQPQPPDSLRGGGGLHEAVEVSAILAPFVAPVVSQVTAHLLDRPSKEPSSQVILPPGVDPK